MKMEVFKLCMSLLLVPVNIRQRLSIDRFKKGSGRGPGLHARCSTEAVIFTLKQYRLESVRVRRQGQGRDLAF